MNWKAKAIELLKDSLYPVPSELNEIDWKSGLSPKSERLAQHLCAFANLSGGGFLVFGVNDDATLFSISKEESDEIIKTIGNIARNNLSNPIIIRHSIEEFEGHSLLFIHVPEAKEKPVYLRGKMIWDTYHRSAGQTVKMSREEVKQMIAESGGFQFDEQIAMDGIDADTVLKMLDYQSYFKLVERALPNNQDTILDVLSNEDFVVKQKDGLWSITNLGALLFARDLTRFKNLQYKTLRIIHYTGKGRLEAYPERDYVEGYACGFEHFIQFIMGQTSVEVIDSALRKIKSAYPERTIRELLANSVIHQNLWQTGMYVMVEIFTNRIEITNPGEPLVDINRFIDTPPKSRNERIAILMRRFNICEQRGSGVDRAIEAVEKAYLPAPKFIKGDGYTKVEIYPKMTFAEMSRDDRIRACYQHCCLRYMNNELMTNQSFRERMEIEEKNYPMASKIIKDTVTAGLIKDAFPESKSRKYASYIPYWG
ncbi:MAG: putative DNA binding domain-containing protein [Prevotellaceae bacterium]|jgi:predicted HTH transcriptional regulator|nr:putative DNA binding domain-containing protein [Prevotellaceae bacterium]